MTMGKYLFPFQNQELGMSLLNTNKKFFLLKNTVPKKKPQHSCRGIFYKQEKQKD